MAEMQLRDVATMAKYMFEQRQASQNRAFRAVNNISPLPPAPGWWDLTDAYRDDYKQLARYAFNYLNKDDEE